MYIQLKSHQKNVVDFMKYNRGVIVYHGLGSGKTLTALESVYQFKHPIIIIGPKSSRKTFIDNIQKVNMNISRFTFYTLTKVKKILESDITLFKNTSVILDEAHNIRNENMYNLYIASALLLASKIVLLTATPVVNYINDLAVLINIVKGEDILPTDRKLFDQMFYDDEKMEIINRNILLDKIRNTISYYKIDDTINYPRTETHWVEVEMNHEQVNEYIYYVKKIIYEDKDIVSDIDILNIDYGLLPQKKRNFFLNVTRQLSNTLNNSEDGPKIQKIFEKIKEGPYPIIVYSNFLKNGIYTLAILLEKNKISYKTITGYTTNDRLQMIVDNYNQRMFKVLLISSAGSESLDLKNTRQIHIMEPHWNSAKIEQVIGRSVRYKSHEALPPEERVVDIYHWVSMFPYNKNIKNQSADQYLIYLSRKKMELWEAFQKVIIESSIENNYLKKIEGGSSDSLNYTEDYYRKYMKYKKKYYIVKKKIEK